MPWRCRKLGGILWRSHQEDKELYNKEKMNIAMMMRGESTHLWSKLIWVDCDSNIENITVTLYTVVEKLKVKINFN